jgi:hypothetical protein
MNPTLINAVAAFGGSSAALLGPILSNYVLQRGLAVRELLNRQIAQRETLYADFINEAARLYAVSITHALDNFGELVCLYALVGRIRLFASEPVVIAAEELVKTIVAHYGEANLSVDQLRQAALSAKADPLATFSLACRKEMREIVQRGEVASEHARRDKKWGLV